MYGTFSLAFWLASQPVGTAAFALIGAGIVVSMLGYYVVNQYFTVMELAPNNIVGGFKFAFLAELYAVTVALCLVGSWEIYQSARDTVQREAATIYFLLQSIPVYNDPSQVEARQDMVQSVRNYAKAVVEKDWDNMRTGRTIAGSDPEFNLLVRAFLDVEPKTAAQQALQQNTAQWLAQVNEYRINRLSSVSRTLAGLLWLLVASSTTIALAFPWFFGSPNQLTQAIMGGLISVTMTGVLLVAVKLAYPFAGEALVAPGMFLTLMN